MREQLFYFINLDERGEFYADIRIGESGKSIVEIDTDYAQFLSQERVNVRDVHSVEAYFKDLGDILKGERLLKGN
jgi:hypothetical protein